MGVKQKNSDEEEAFPNAKFNFRKVSAGDIFTFVKMGEGIVGKLMNIREGQFGNNVYDINSDGNRYTVFGTKVLDSTITSDMVGKVVKIEYKGEAEGKSGRTFKNFDVFVAE